MGTHALTLPTSLPANLRAFDIRRDLRPVADLVEMCFADTLDADGRLYIRQMREAAASGPLLEMAAAGSRRIDLPLAGYVWVENEQVVANLSLIPHRHGQRRLYLIANVAVHPDFRRHGIAKMLTQAALQRIQDGQRYETWLQVDENNPAAIELYRNMGFVERLRRTSWRAKASQLQTRAEEGVSIDGQRPEDWDQQKAWLEANYPNDVLWQLPLDARLLQPGWRGSLERALSERRIEQWSARRGRSLLGVLSWQSSTLEADRLWLAADKADEDAAIPGLMAAAQSINYAGRPLALNYPNGRGVAALEAAGFRAARTLIWMNYPWSERT